MVRLVACFLIMTCPSPSLMLEFIIPVYILSTLLSVIIYVDTCHFIFSPLSLPPSLINNGDVHPYKYEPSRWQAGQYRTYTLHIHCTPNGEDGKSKNNATIIEEDPDPTIYNPPKKKMSRKENGNLHQVAQELCSKFRGYRNIPKKWSRQCEYPIAANYGPQYHIHCTPPTRLILRRLAYYSLAFSPLSVPRSRADNEDVHPCKYDPRRGRAGKYRTYTPCIHCTPRNDLVVIKVVFDCRINKKRWTNSFD